MSDKKGCAKRSGDRPAAASTTLRRVARKLAIVAVSACMAAGVTLGWCWSPKAPTYKPLRELSAVRLAHRFRNSAEHDAALARVGNPYVLEIDHGDGALLYYGARHTSDAHDPQFDDIQHRWKAFRPSVALCEGRSRGYGVRFPLTLLAGVSEPAHVHRLARRGRVPMFSLEPAYEEEVAELLKNWSAEQVALYFTMRVYWSEAGGTPSERLAEHLRAKRTAVSGLRGSLESIDDMNAIWRRDFAEQADWRGLSVEPRGTYLEEISDASRQVRGEYMARTLIELVRSGERVLAVVGSGHVIRQEWAIREALGAAPAPDQPSTAGDLH